MVLYSMTGFGSSQTELQNVNISIEIKSVNNRFLDVQFRLPSLYQRFEIDLLKLVKSKLKRGRIDIFVVRQESKKQRGQFRLNQDVYKSGIEAVNTAQSLAGIEDEVFFIKAVSNLMARREILDFENDIETITDASFEYENLKQCLLKALDSLNSMRKREGEGLETEIFCLLGELDTTLKGIDSKAKNIPSDLQRRLIERIERLDCNIKFEPSRLEQEIAILAERVDVREEISRLFCHIDQFKKIIDKEEGGRKLDFLLQECSREINTCGSKIQSTDITPSIIEAKSIIEKIREQVQNLE